MNITLIGAGLQAQAIAHDLTKCPTLKRLTIVDHDAKSARSLARQDSSRRSTAVTGDATNPKAMAKAIAGADCTIGATTYAHNPLLTEIAIEAGSHFCDLGGNNDVVKAQRKMSRRAKEMGVTVVPDCGLAPGMTNLLAYHWTLPFSDVESLQIRVGGLPIDPQTALEYQLVFSVQGLINEYIEDCDILREGKRLKVPGLSGRESLGFGKPFNKLEAFYTSGGTSTLPQTLRGKAANLDYKTIRYPGHVEKIRLLHDLGLFSSMPVNTPEGPVVPRALSAKLLQSYLPDSGDDVVLIRIAVQGRLNATGEGETTAHSEYTEVTRTYDCIDNADAATGLSAMQRTTGFPVAIIARMLAEGSVPKCGVVPQERAIDGGQFLNALSERGIAFKRRQRRAG